jgi:hypothetical protein
MTIRTWQPGTTLVERIGRVRAGDVITVRTSFRGVGEYVPTNQGIGPHIQYIPDQSETSDANDCLCTTWPNGTPRKNIQLIGTLQSDRDADDFFRIDFGCKFYCPYDGQLNLTGGEERIPGVEIDYSVRRVPDGDRPMIDPTFTFRDLVGVFTKIPRGTMSLIVRQPIALRFRTFGVLSVKNFDPVAYPGHPIGDLSQGEFQSVAGAVDVACVLNL